VKFGAPVWPFTQELDREYVLALEYRTDLARGVDMEVE
jgi:hypothetical protein